MVQELLKFKLRYGRPYLLVRWAGSDASGDTWEPLDSLTECAEAISAFKRATGRVLPRPAPKPPAVAAAQYTLQTSALCGTADSLLVVSARRGVLRLPMRAFVPAPAAGFVRALRSRGTRP